LFGEEGRTFQQGFDVQGQGVDEAAQVNKR